jgi:hypothetical protein
MGKRGPNPVNVHEGYASLVCYTASGGISGRLLVSTEDLPLVARYRWHITPDGYGQSHDAATGRGIMIHRLIMGVAREVGRWKAEVDHIDRDRANNRRENLRLTTRMQNASNVAKYRNGKRVGVGREWGKGHRWFAYITILGHERLQLFATYEQAVAQREAWEAERDRLLFHAEG